MDTEYAQWCSFCTSAQACGELDIPEIGVGLPVCSTCMDDYENAVLPLIRELLKDE